MNIFSVLGLLLAVVVFGVGLRLATPNLGMFWDVPSVFIVVGGTLASTAIAYRLDKIFILFKSFFLIIFIKHSVYKLNSSMNG